MKVLELNFERSWRGGEKQTVLNTLGLLELGIDVCLVCRKNHPLEKEATARNIKTYGFKNIFGLIFFLLTKGKKFDILHSQTSHVLTYCLLTKPFHQRRIVFTRRVDFVPSGKLTKFKYLKTDKIVAISSAVKTIVQQFTGRDDVLIISDAVSEEPMNVERAKKEIKIAGLEGFKIAATTAALVDHKDPFTMVYAIENLWKIRKDFIFFHFGEGPLKLAVQQLIEEKGLQECYRLMGFKKNVVDFFSVMDVFVMSSKEEGLGSSILDAFLYKVPVVTTNAGGIRDIISTERGFFCMPYDAPCLAAAINEVLTNKPIQKVENAVQFVLKHHSVKHISNAYYILFNDLLNNHLQKRTN